MNINKGNTISLINIRNLLVTFSLLSVLNSQFSLTDSFRISVPFKEITTLLFIFFLPIELIYSKISSKIIFLISLLLVFSSFGLLTSIFNYGSLDVGLRLNFGFSSIYLYIYTLAIIYSFYSNDSFIRKRIFKISMIILYSNCLLALFIYILFILNLNPLLLGINISGGVRIFGLMTEPSQFSIISALTFFLHLQIRKTDLVPIFLKKIPFFSVLIFLSFVLSFSPVGGIFFLTVFLLKFFIKNLSFEINFSQFIKYSFSLIAICFVLFVFKDYPLIQRSIERINSDFSLLQTFLEGTSPDFQKVLTPGASRVVRLVLNISTLKNLSFSEYFIGAGPLTQIIYSANIDQAALSGLFYTFFAYGLLTNFIFFVLVFLNYKIAFFETAYLWIPFLLLMFINAPGGQFGSQFLVIFLLILNSGTWKKNQQFIKSTKIKKKDIFNIA